MEFKWNSNKASINYQKHGVSFSEAITVFGDVLALTFDDPIHSENESRYLTFGLSNLQRFIIVSHTYQNDVTRIISARIMTPGERRIYENG